MQILQQETAPHPVGEMIVAEKPPFKEWKRMIRDTHKTSEAGWRMIQKDWLVSTKENVSYQQCAFHICRESWKRDNTIVRLDQACLCGEVLPEGARMVAMLLDSL